MKTKLIIVIFCLFASITVFAQESYKLSYKFEKGKTYFINTTSSTESTTLYSGQEMTTANEVKSRTKMDITDSSTDKFEIITTLETYYIKMIGMNGEENVNNGEKLIGRQAKLLYNKTGLCTDKALLNDTNKTKKDNVGSIQMILQFPDNPVKIGETWNSIDSSKYVSEYGESKALNNTTFKLEGKEKTDGKECFKITLIRKTKNNGTFSQGDASSITEGITITNGTFYFDIDAGMMIKYEANSDSNQNVAVPERSVSYDSVSKTKMSITLTDK